MTTRDTDRNPAPTARRTYPVTMDSSPEPWRAGFELNIDLGHFTAERHPAGTPVEVRTYLVDDKYLEALLPDGIIVTVELGHEVIESAEDLA